MKRKITFRRSFLVVFFALQVLGILIGKFSDVRYFCWAPYDQFSFYEMNVSIDGRELSEGEILQRYRMDKRGRNNRNIHNVISKIRQYEKTFSKGKNVTVELSYEINGYRQETWIWPQDKVISE